MTDRSYLDWPFFKARHRAWAARVEDWATQNATREIVHHRTSFAGGNFVAALMQTYEPGAGTLDVDATCRALVGSLGVAGLLGAAAPANAPLDVRTLCLARDVLARHAGLADFAFAMQGLGTGAVTLFGTAAQKAAVLPGVRAGRDLAAFALSEAEAGSDVAALAMTAVQDGDAWVLDGEKTWISNGGIARWYVVFARTGPGEGTKGLSAFLVPDDAPGFSVAARIAVAAPHPLATLRFDQCRVGAEALIGEAGQGFRIAMAVLDVFRSTVGAAALGFARRALDEAVAHAKRRHLFGAPLAEMPVTQAALADMATEVDAAALLVYRAAWAKDQGAARVTREASMAKLFATEAAARVVDRATQLHGGLGVTAGHIMEQLTRDVRALRIYEGASEVQRVVIARQVLG